jgi:transmembrane sensor
MNNGMGNGVGEGMGKETDMHASAGIASIDEARFAVAADWLQRLDQPALDEEEMQQWLAWLASSERNAQAFDEASRLRQRLRGMPQDFKRELQARVPALSSRPRAGGARWYKAVAIAACLCVVALMHANLGQGPAGSTETVYAVPAGEFRTVALQDGSSLVLGTDAAVAVAFDEKRRVLDVHRGGAYFEVQHDAHRPFVVRAAGVKVTAIGTAFNVSRLADRVVVTVTEGVVEVEQEQRINGSAVPMRLRLAAGHRKELALAPRIDPPIGSSSAALPEWRSGRIEFVNTPLREVLSLVNRHAPVRIAIDDPRLEGLTYSGTVERVHIDEWIASLPHVYGIRAVKLDDGSVTLVSGRTPDRQ